MHGGPHWRWRHGRDEGVFRSRRLAPLALGRRRRPEPAQLRERRRQGRHAQADFLGARAPPAHRARRVRQQPHVDAPPRGSSACTTAACAPARRRGARRGRPLSSPPPRPGEGERYVNVGSTATSSGPRPSACTGPGSTVTASSSPAPAAALAPCRRVRKTELKERL